MWIASLLAASVVAAAPGPGPSPKRARIDRIIAIVNNEVITEHQLKAAAEEAGANAPGLDHNAGRRQLLDRLIDERLMDQQIRAAHIEVGDADIERAIQDILTQNQITLEQLEQAILGRGLSMQTYRQTLQAQLRRLRLIEQKVRSQIVVPERAVNAEYARRTAGEAPAQLVHIQHIFLPWSKPSPAERAATLKTLAGLRARAEGGADFGALAKEASKGPTADSGGDLGEIPEKGLLPALAKGIRGLNPGALSAPIETDGGVHLVKLLGRRDEDTNNGAALKAKIRQELYTREAEAQMKTWLEQLRADAAIDIRLNPGA